LLGVGRPRLGKQIAIIITMTMVTMTMEAKPTKEGKLQFANAKEVIAYQLINSSN